jgi:hypothetical protein
MLVIFKYIPNYSFNSQNIIYIVNNQHYKAYNGSVFTAATDSVIDASNHSKKAFAIIPVQCGPICESEVGPQSRIDSINGFLNKLHMITPSNKKGSEIKEVRSNNNSRPNSMKRAISDKRRNGAISGKSYKGSAIQQSMKLILPQRSNLPSSSSIDLPSMDKLEGIFMNASRGSSNKNKSYDDYSFQCKNIAEDLKAKLDMKDKLPEPKIRFRLDSRLKMPVDVSGTLQTHGLENSQRILPDYYLTGKDLKGKMLNIDYITVIYDDIHNMRPLNEYQLAYIDALEGEEKQRVVIALNNTLKIMTSAL